MRPSCLLRSEILFLCGLFLFSIRSYAQEDEVEPGHSIGKVSTNGDLIVLELNERALGKANQFDLVGRTLRFYSGAFGLSRREWASALGCRLRT